MILPSKQHAKHPFTGLSTQYSPTRIKGLKMTFVLQKAQINLWLNKMFKKDALTQDCWKNPHKSQTLIEKP